MIAASWAEEALSPPDAASLLAEINVEADLVHVLVAPLDPGWWMPLFGSAREFDNSSPWGVRAAGPGPHGEPVAVVGLEHERICPWMERLHVLDWHTEI